MSEELASKLLRDDVLIPVLVFSGVIIIMLLKTLASVLKTFARERSRREIAAFIAEGTMSPEQGEKLMKAEPKE
jgi:hypothetical protein